MRPPILVTGISIPDHRRKSQRGFTLLEILVVVIIVIITVSAVIFSTTLSRGDKDLQRLGNDLGKFLHLIYQEAIFENRNYAISLNSGGFNVLEYNGEAWSISEQSFYRKIKLGEAQRSTLVVNNQDITAVDPGSAIPHILILSSGEMSAFEWYIIDENLNSQITLQGDLLGNVLVVGPASLSDV